MSKRARILGFGSAALLVVVGIVCAMLVSGTLGQNLAFVLVALGLVEATALVFYEVGLTEDREREREGKATERAREGTEWPGEGAERPGHGAERPGKGAERSRPAGEPHGPERPARGPLPRMRGHSRRLR